MIYKIGYMKNINEIFFELIQVALGKRVCLSHSPTEDEWKMLYDMAKKQSLVGVCFAGMQRLQDQYQTPPEMLYWTWLGMAAKIQQKNEVTNKQCAEFQKMLDADGYKSCVLKGQAVASLYGSLAGLRQSGDIDTWMVAEPQEVIEWARATGSMYYYDYHHADLSLFQEPLTGSGQGTEIELHYRPSLSRNLVRNARLQRWFKEEGAKHIVYHENLGFAVPDYIFNVVLTMNHNFWHLLYEGVGMRQMMDLYFGLRSALQEDKKACGEKAVLTKTEKKSVETADSLLEPLANDCLAEIVSKLPSSTNQSSAPLSGDAVSTAKNIKNLQDESLKLLKHLKLLRFASASMWIMKEVFGLDDEYLLGEPDADAGSFLLDEIMQAGNFGKHDDRLGKDRYSSRMRLFGSWVKHNLRLIRQYPKDVLWTPIGILYITLWRRIKSL